MKDFFDIGDIDSCLFNNFSNTDEHRLFGVRRGGRHLDQSCLAVNEQYQVCEGAADVNANSRLCHVISPQCRPNVDNEICMRSF
ncbi:hypothetical protein D9M68_686100 [compost metagenome]